MMPKSTGTRSPWASMKMLPGCMSPWKKPSRNTCLKKISAARARIRSGSNPAASRAARSSEAMPLDPLQREHAPRGALPVDLGHMKAFVVGEVLGRARTPRRPPGADPSRAGSRRRRSRPRRSGAAGETPGCRRSTQAAIQAKKSRSRAICRSIAGRRILTATSSPSVVTAKWTWAIEAAATGRSSKLANSSSIGAPSSASIIQRARARSNGGRSSWSCDRSAASSWPSRSERVARLWPSLMKLGPRSCNAMARRWPGRPGASWRDSRRASRRTRSGIGRRSSGNSALCRARQRAMPIRRQMCRRRAEHADCPRGARPNAAPRCPRTGRGSARDRTRPARSCARRSPDRESGGCSRPDSDRRPGPRPRARRARAGR